MSGLRVAFMGTPEFSVPALKAIHDSAHEVICVYTQPPRPKGRGQQIQKSPVHEFALEQDIPVFTPGTLKKKEAQDEFAAHGADIAVVVAYGLLLPVPVLAAPRYGCINIHASLLPRWRGASPIQQAIWQGDKETGITIMQMDEGLDTGPVIVDRAVEIHGATTASSLHDQLSNLGARMIVQVLDIVKQNKKVISTPQDDSKSTYAPLLKKEDGKINWTQTAGEIDRQIRALNPWPGVYCAHESERLKILSVLVVPKTSNEKPGTVLDRDGHVACAGGGVLRLLKIQPANARAMDFSAAINGGYIQEGALLA